MFGLGPQELIMILIVVLVMFGGKKIPEIMKGLGQGIREFRSASTNAIDEVRSLVDVADEPDPQSKPKPV